MLFRSGPRSRIEDSDAVVPVERRQPQWQTQASGPTRAGLEQRMARMQSQESWAGYDFQIVEAGRGFFELQTRKRGDVQASEKRVYDTPEFKRWFGKSKVTDGRGRPMVVYHGTTSDFSVFEFDESRKGDDGIAGDAFYFAPNPGEASGYATAGLGSGANVIPVYLRAQNPLVWDYFSPEGKRLQEKRADLEIGRAHV